MGRTPSVVVAVMLSVASFVSFSSVACAPGPSDSARPTATVGPVLPSPRTTPAAPVVPSVPTPTVGPSEPVAVMPAFRSSVSGITPRLAERMTPTSWREGCPVPLEDLRYLTVSHVTFDGSATTGELVVHADVADDVVDVFATLYEARFPLRSMRLIDDYDGDDDASMAADNTSAFNCRAVRNGESWSEHAYGQAIDINPVENPYVLEDEVAPPAGSAFLDRPDLPG